MRIVDADGAVIGQEPNGSAADAIACAVPVFVRPSRTIAP